MTPVGFGPASFLKIVYRPVAQLEEVRRHPRIWPPFIAGCIISVLADVIGLAGASAKYPMIKDQGVLFWAWTGGWTLLGPAYSILITAALCWGCCRVARTSATYEEVFSMSSHLYVVSALGPLARAAIWRLAPHGTQASQGILPMLAGGSLRLVSSLASYIVLQLWYCALLGLGLRIVGRVRTWVAYAVPIGLLVARVALWKFGPSP
jgi:hypothetical protein